MPACGTGAEAAVIALARTAMAQGMAALAVQDGVAALRWLERAHRLLPLDPNTTMALAGACLQTDPARAAALFADIAEKYDVRQAWLGLATARLRLGRPDTAADPLARLLSRHALKPDIAVLADRIAARSGWCGLCSDGRLEIHTAAQGPVTITLDGKPARGRMLPRHWPSAHMVEIRQGNTELLGSPIQPAAIRRLAGCVEVEHGGLRGWAWHPNDPDTAPVLTLTAPFQHTEQVIVASDESTMIPDTGPMARPRSFHLSRADLPDAPGLIHIRGPDGRDLPGSPLDPFAAEAASVAAAVGIAQAYPAEHNRIVTTIAPALGAGIGLPQKPVGADGRRRLATIVIPVHNGGSVTLPCLASVLGSIPPSARVLVIDDGSTDPGLITALDDLARCRKINLLRHRHAQGFPASANAGIRTAKGRDVVLLNSDTLVPPGWLERLQAAAYASFDIGTVTPLSNEASILSYPGRSGSNEPPDQATTNRLDRLAKQANGAALVDIPVGVGFCLYLRRDCLNATGVFRSDVFAQGYGEENDLCLRARRLGWRNVALTGLFVGHLGGASFSGSAAHLRKRNSRIIDQLHPEHQVLIDRFVAADPLAPHRRRMDLVSWKQRARDWPQAAILITHNDGGGVEQQVRRSADMHVQAHRRPIVLHPGQTAGGEPAIAVRDGAEDKFFHMIFAMPRELPSLLRLLRAAKPIGIEAHHLANYPPFIYDLIAQLAVPYDVHVHDYAWFCPRISLVGSSNHYCGEPDLHDCESCVADNGHFLKEDITVASLRRRSAEFLQAARRVLVPADDVGIRMQRQFSGLSTLTMPHEDDAGIPVATVPKRKAKSSTHEKDGILVKARHLVCVVGAIGVHKGFDVLLACARDAARRNLELGFIVVGHTIDDARLMATGRVFVTGRFKPQEAVGMIAAQGAGIGFVPSITPETWCLALGEIWRAGLPAVAFDIGAPAERIKRTGRGLVLPLGLPANAINNRLIATLRMAKHC